ncbi:MAG TPA: hypothetical protein VGJ59_09790 [Jatrophihabitantaceae bacterium]
MILLPETTTCTWTTPYCVRIACPAMVCVAPDVEGADVEGADLDLEGADVEGADVEGVVLGSDARREALHGRPAGHAT